MEVITLTCGCSQAISSYSKVGDSKGCLTHNGFYQVSEVNLVEYGQTYRDCYSLDNIHTYCEQVHGGQQPCLKRVAEALTNQHINPDNFSLVDREFIEYVTPLINIVQVIQDALEELTND